MVKTNILLTGGHAATAGIAVVEALGKLKNIKNPQFYWVGSKTAIEGKNIPTLESKIFPKLGVTFYPITAGKLQTKFTIYTIPSILKIPVGFMEALIALLRIRPKVVLSFGGFSSFPVVFWSKLAGIPVIIHEQTSAIGRAFLASVPFANRILLAREESVKYIKNRKAEVVGNPLMTGILSVEQKSGLPQSPTILVIGGSRGSNFLNELMLVISKEMLKEFRIIHLTGETDYNTQIIYRNSLEKSLRDKYEVHSTIDPFKMNEIYHKADIVIARSGANTVAELIHVKRPTIFIPLPRTHLREQEKNAEYAVNLGLGVSMTELEATPTRVKDEVNNLIKNWKTISEKLKKLESPDIDASKKIAAIVSEYC